MGRSPHEHLTPTLVQDFVSERLPPETHRRAEAHLADCPECRAEVEEQREFEEIRRGFSALDALPTRPSLPGFTVERFLGRGGCGEVWLARDDNLLGPRALKVLRSDRYTPAALAALREEARTVERLGKHDNRVTVHLLSGPADGLLLVMEYVDGGPLSEQAPLPWERAVRYVIDAAEGLQDVHVAGLVHGDIKPQNLLWDRKKDRAVLCDFGLARHADQAARGWTPGYAAPEVIGGQCGFAGDVFSLAATLCGLLVGEGPKDDGGRVLRGEELGRKLESVPLGVHEVVQAGLEPEPARRPGLAEFQARLRWIHLDELARRLGERARRSTCPVVLDVTVSAADPGRLQFRPVLRRSSRDGGEGPAKVRTGDLVQIEARTNTAGFVTVLNFSPGGGLSVLLPSELAPDNRVAPEGRQGLIARIEPPSGTDSFAVVWTASPVTAPAGTWRDWLAGGPFPGTTRATFVTQISPEAPDKDWAGVLFTLVHDGP